MATLQRHKAPGFTTLPHELILLILSKLPIELLLRFKSVSKQWCSLMTHPSLVDAHREAHSPRTLFLSNRDRGYDHAIQLHMLDHELKLRSVPVAYPGRKFHIAGSCNGFLCMTSARSSQHTLDPIIVCNPITRESIVLPHVQSSSDRGYIVQMQVGFGFCPSSMEYKVLRIIKSHLVRNQGPRNGDEFQKRCEVLTLGSIMEWRELSVADDHVLSGFDDILAVDNRMYWLAEDGTRILSFHIGSETFQSMPSPSNPDDKKDDWPPALENLASRLVLAEAEAETRNLRVWLLVNAESNVWTQMYSISMNCLLMHAQLSSQVHRIGEHIVPILKLKEIFQRVLLISLDAVTKDNSTNFAISIDGFNHDGEEAWKVELEFARVPVRWITTDYVPTLVSLNGIINHG